MGIRSRWWRGWAGWVEAGWVERWRQSAGRGGWSVLSFESTPFACL